MPKERTCQLLLGSSNKICWTVALCGVLYVYYKYRIVYYMVLFLLTALERSSVLFMSNITVSQKENLL